MLRVWVNAAVVLWLAARCVRAAAPLYTEEDPVVILSSSSLKTTVSNSSTAWLVQFYSSWCGHCIQYSSTWKDLAQDVKGTEPLLESPTPDFVQNAQTVQSQLFHNKTINLKISIDIF